MLVDINITYFINARLLLHKYELNNNTFIKRVYILFENKSKRLIVNENKTLPVYL